MSVMLPSAAFLCGWLAPRSGVASALALAGGLIAAGAAVPLARACRRTAWPEPEAVTLPWLSVIVPARDESAVIADLIGDLGRQDHVAGDGSPRFDVTIVDDRSRDATAIVAEAALRRARLDARSRVLRRRAPAPDGKGAALASVPLDGLPGEAVLVLDADARIGPDFLRRAAELIAGDAGAATARRRMLEPSRGGRLARLLAQIQDDEQTIDGEIQLGRQALGGASELRGNGMVVSRDLLARVGGWDAGALCEDLELSTRLFGLTGRGAGWSRDLEVWEEPILEPRALLRQRMRWAEGLVRRDLRETLPLMAQGRIPRRQRLDLLLYLSQSLSPVAAAGLLATHSRKGRRRLAVLTASYAVGAGLIAYDALRWSVDANGAAPSPLNRACRAVAVVAWSALWLLVLPVAHVRVALGRGPLRFAKTVHRGGHQCPSDLRGGAAGGP
jgi:glycosyltransferase involved in cell wall biosynthesis